MIGHGGAATAPSCGPSLRALLCTRAAIAFAVCARGRSRPATWRCDPTRHSTPTTAPSNVCVSLVQGSKGGAGALLDVDGVSVAIVGAHLASSSLDNRLRDAATLCRAMARSLCEIDRPPTLCDAGGTEPAQPQAAPPTVN